MAKVRWFFMQHRYMILSAAFVVLLIVWVLDRKIENFDAIKPESLMKIAIGIITVSIMSGYSWVLMDAIPYFKDKINPDEKQKELCAEKELTPWQKTLVVLLERFLAFLWYALFLSVGLRAIGSF